MIYFSLTLVKCFNINFSETYEWEQIHYGGMFFSRKLHVCAVVAHHMLLYGG